MLRERIAVILLLLPLLMWVIAEGEWLYLAAILLVTGLAAAEYGLMFQGAGWRPSLPLLVAGVIAMILLRKFSGFSATPLALVGVAMAAMIWHAVDYEKGAESSGSDFALTLAGIVYLGWFGGYFISFRDLPDGEWWMLIALPSVWIADSAAYFFGKAFGRRKLSPRLSPNKTWVGYWSGVLFGTLSGGLFALLWGIGAGSGSSLDVIHGTALGFLLAGITPWGDLGISMIKRQLKTKDTGRILPGHGGALDRLDTWIWAVVIGFYFVNWTA